MNQGQGDVSPPSFFLKYGQIWNHVLKKKSQVSLIIRRSNVKLHMRRTKLQFESIQTGKSSTVRSNVERNSKHDLSVCFRRTNSVKSNVELNK